MSNNLKLKRKEDGKRGTVNVLVGRGITRC